MCFLDFGTICNSQNKFWVKSLPNSNFLDEFFGVLDYRKWNFVKISKKRKFFQDLVSAVFFNIAFCNFQPCVFWTLEQFATLKISFGSSFTKFKFSRWILWCTWLQKMKFCENLKKKKIFSRFSERCFLQYCFL